MITVPDGWTWIGTRVALFLVLASCRGNTGAACTKDAECSAGLVCHFESCTDRVVKAQAEEKARTSARNERARAFLKQKFHLSDVEAARFSFFGQRLVIAHDQAHLEVCLEPEEPDAKSFKILFAGSVSARLCGGKADDRLSFGEVVGAGGP